MEPPESDESNSLALRLPAVAREAFWETEVSPPGRSGLAPTGLASRSFARPFSLGGSLGFSPPPFCKLLFTVWPTDLEPWKICELWAEIPLPTLLLGKPSFPHC
jgi:hypothetical protein